MHERTIAEPDLLGQCCAARSAIEERTTKAALHPEGVVQLIAMNVDHRNAGRNPSVSATRETGASHFMMLDRPDYINA
jgi:hypothetical protein